MRSPTRRTTSRPAITLAIALTLPLLAAPAHADDPGVVEPRAETPPLFNDEAGGDSDADDPAIWAHPEDTAKSVVIGTAKEGGLYVYRLDGTVLQHLPAPPPPNPGDAPGRFNNVDLRYGFELADGRKVDLAVVSDRGHDRLRVYRIDADRAAHGRAPLVDVTDPTAAPLVFSADQDEVNEERTAYGLTTFTEDGDTFAVASQADATGLALMRLLPTDGGVGYEVTRRTHLPSSFTLPDGTTWRPCGDPGELPTSEGLVVDPADDTLYVAQEQVGIWRMDADLDGGDRELVDRVREYGVPASYDPATDECVPGADPGYGGTNLSADVEGLTIYHGEDDDDGYLIASSQGDSTYAVYERGADDAGDHIGSFRVGDPRGADPVRETDGIAVLNTPLGGFDKGLFVTQDGANKPDRTDENGEVREQTNFKFVAWEDIAGTFDPRLFVAPDGWDPRD